MASLRDAGVLELSTTEPIEDEGSSPEPAISTVPSALASSSSATTWFAQYPSHHSTTTNSNQDDPSVYEAQSSVPQDTRPWELRGDLTLSMAMSPELEGELASFSMLLGDGHTCELTQSQQLRAEIHLGNFVQLRNELRTLIERYADQPESLFKLMSVFERVDASLQAYDVFIARAVSNRADREAARTNQDLFESWLLHHGDEVEMPTPADDDGDDGDDGDTSSNDSSSDTRSVNDGAESDIILGGVIPEPPPMPAPPRRRGVHRDPNRNSRSRRLMQMLETESAASITHGSHHAQPPVAQPLREFLGALNQSNAIPIDPNATATAAATGGGGDDDAIEEETFECPVCIEDVPIRATRTLACGHQYCTSVCIKHTPAYERERDTSVS